MIDPLSTLADLIDGGHAPAEALDLLARADEAVWVQGAAQSARAGADIAGALARSGAVSPAEVERVGGAARLADPAALRLLAAHRRRRRLERRTRLAALALPGLLAISFAVTGLWLPRGWGARLLDLSPFLVLVALILLAGTGRIDPLLDRIGARRRREVDGLRALSCAAPLDGSGFARAAALLPPGPLERACERAARRLADGAPLVECTPAAAEVGPALAGAALAGIADPDRLHRAADAAEQARARRSAFAVRIVAFAAACVVGVRVAIAVMTTDLGGLEALEGLEGLDGLQRLLPGVDPAALDELMREIDGR